MKHGPYKHIGKGKERSTSSSTLLLARTVIMTASTCECTPGKCKYAARECRDWIKRAARNKD